MDKLSEINHGAKVVLGGAIVFLILSFFNWQEVDLGAFGEAGVSMWHGVGWIAGLLAIAIIVWQAIRLSNMNFEIGVGPAMVTAFLAVLLLLFTVIKFFADSEFRTWAAWVGLILAIVIAGVIGFRAGGPPYGVPIGLAVAWLGVWMTRAAAANRLAQRP